MKILLEKYRFWLNCWGIVFSILCLVFLFYMTTFYIGNHDWQYVRYGVKFTNGFWEGRLTQFLFPVLLLNSAILPIWGALWGLASFAGAAILLARWYQLPQQYVSVTFFSLLITLNPYICTQLYYTHTVMSVLSWHLFSVTGVICAWKFSANLQIKWLMIALICLWSALAGYASSLELILTIIGGKLLFDVMAGTKLNLTLIKRYIVLGLIVSLVAGGYVFSVYLLKLANILNSHMYNVQMLSLKDVWLLIFQQWDMPFRVFFLTDMPYMSYGQNILLLFLVVLVICIAYQKRRLILCGGVLIGIFYAAFILAYFSPFGMFKAMRVHSFSVSYIGAILFAVILLYGHKFKKNMALLEVFILLSMYLKADFMNEKVWYLGTEQDERVVDRVRSEILPQIKKDKHYRLSSVGSFYGRQKFAGFDELSFENREDYREYYGYGLFLYRFFSAGLFMYEDVNPIWGEGTYLGNYLRYFLIYESIPLKHRIDAEIFAKHFGADKEKLIAAADKLCAYPCKDFYYVGEKDILLMVSKDEVSRLVLKWNIENNP